MVDWAPRDRCMSNGATPNEAQRIRRSTFDGRQLRSEQKPTRAARQSVSGWPVTGSTKVRCSRCCPDRPTSLPKSLPTRAIAPISIAKRWRSNSSAAPNRTCCRSTWRLRRCLVCRPKWSSVCQPAALSRWRRPAVCRASPRRHSRLSCSTPNAARRDRGRGARANPGAGGRRRHDPAGAFRRAGHRREHPPKSDRAFHRPIDMGTTHLRFGAAFALGAAGIMDGCRIGRRVSGPCHRDCRTAPDNAGRATTAAGGISASCRTATR